MNGKDGGEGERQSPSRKQPLVLLFGLCEKAAPSLAGCNHGLRRCGVMKVKKGRGIEPARRSAASSYGHFYCPRGR